MHYLAYVSVLAFLFYLLFMCFSGSPSGPCAIDTSGLSNVEYTGATSIASGESVAITCAPNRLYSSGDAFKMYDCIGGVLSEAIQDCTGW